MIRCKICGMETYGLGHSCQGRKMNKTKEKTTSTAGYKKVKYVFDKKKKHILLCPFCLREFVMNL